MVPTQVKWFSINKAPKQDAEWLLQTLNREVVKLGARVEHEGNILRLVWNK
ncbi:MAG: hypothetical protein OEX02_19155 [Cyclobacteriaceae bacterium]|nr:hypothetical protein [Cyclobacteriaceae bacterium]